MEELDTLVVSDTHFGREGLGEAMVDIERKEQASRNIAGFIRRHGKRLRIILNGDIFHRPNGNAPNEGEKFNQSFADYQVRPLAKVLRAGGHDIRYLAGNCDPWAAGTDTDQIRLVRMLGLRQQQVKFPGYVDQFDDVLVTHGHLFSAHPFDSLRELAGVHAVATHIPENVFEKAEKPTPEFHDWVASSDRAGGLHHVTFQLKRVLEFFLSLAPTSWKDELLHRMRSAWDRAHRRSFLQHASSRISKGVRTLVMGHTHMPSLRTDDVDGEVVRTVNSGSAGADNTENGAGTMVLLRKHLTLPEFWYTYHPDTPNEVTPADIPSINTED